ncbi:hypothetical protein CWE09_09395 [Aliidiomarina minuta]|uniref:Magnesium transporter n=1 Tax=Aliidiomarina minuta TaxID=880057 RepID=A0A432W9U2_9GAMM|nr:magnesium transporter [Aliidiomarina minuta]RUO26884.1 hypothetical protein CWE09_09395 [Aliidiomarina minuta]
MLFYHHHLTTALHSRLSGSLADEWLKAAAQVDIQHLAEDLLLLDIEDLAARFIELDVSSQLGLIQCFTEEEVAALVKQLRPIARRRLLKQLPLKELARVFGRLPLDIRNAALRHLNRPKQQRFWKYRKAWHKAFSYDPKVSILSLQTSVAEAIDYYYSQAHQSHYLYVVDEHGIFYGVVSGRVLANITKTSAPIGLFVQQACELIVPDHDADFVAHCLSHYQVPELPVVNQHYQLLGVVDIDDLG